MHRNKIFIVAILLAVFVYIALISGCAAPVPFKPRTLNPPEIVNCVDTLGHIPGNKPFIIGGHCYCNPSYLKYGLWQKDGFFKGMTYEEVVNLYKEKGFLISDSKKRNNCNGEAHAALGGKCLMPPTPGTLVYERVVSGDKVSR